jgi:hypothetical protein
MLLVLATPIAELIKPLLCLGHCPSVRQLIADVIDGDSALRVKRGKPDGKLGHVERAVLFGRHGDNVANRLSEAFSVIH